MTTRNKLIIGALSAAVVALAIALGVSIAADDDDGMGTGMMSGGGGYMGLMQAMGDMDSDEMLARMQEVLGPEDYQRMLNHIAEHRSGGGMAGSGMDGMMHRMMDGMMQQMPADDDGVMPMTPH